MTFTYTGDIQNNEIDWVRFIIGDTVESTKYLYDEEIQALIDMYGTKEEAAKKAMERILVVLSERVDHKIGKTSVSMSTMYDNYKKRYDDFVADLNVSKTKVPASCSRPPVFDIGMNDWRF